MSRLFIFAIGGTGSRVLKSLTMLLAAGVKPNSAVDFEIVPIIIDPHKTNKDLERTEKLLYNYQNIVKEIGTKSGFFSTEIKALHNIVNSSQISDNFSFGMEEVNDKKFSEFIDYGSLNDANQGLVDLLFSGKSIDKRNQKVNLLDIEMDIGFVGNPNVGSVVLNQFKESDVFKEFTSNFNANDRIFIISSIFGGTGAAGFPTILKNIRNSINNANVGNAGFLSNAKIGAVTVMPYFNIAVDENSPIQYADFVAKTKAALHYYKDNVTGNNSINALYYIGDDIIGNPYPADPGYGGQKNDAHFIELAAALSIIDYLELSDSQLTSNNGKAINPIYKEFGIRNNNDTLTFNDFDIGTEKKIALRLSQFTLFKKFSDEELKKSINKEAWSTSQPLIDSAFYESDFRRIHISDFFEKFEHWLKEMSGNRRGFSPLSPNASLDSLITGREVTKGFFKPNFDYTYINNKLSQHSNGRHYTSEKQKYIKLFYDTTEFILGEKFGLNAQ